MNLIHPAVSEEIGNTQTDTARGATGINNISRCHKCASTNYINHASNNWVGHHYLRRSVYFLFTLAPCFSFFSPAQSISFLFIYHVFAFDHLWCYTHRFFFFFLSNEVCIYFSYLDVSNFFEMGRGCYRPFIEYKLWILEFWKF